MTERKTILVSDALGDKWSGVVVGIKIASAIGNEFDVELLQSGYRDNIIKIYVDCDNVRGGKNIVF